MPKGQKGGAAPGERRGGRQKGTKNLVSKRERMRKECQASGQTPLAYMLAKMRDPVAPMEMRNWAANAAAPYVHPKLAAATKADGSDLPVNLAMTDRELARRIALILERADMTEVAAESAEVGSSGVSVAHSAGGVDAAVGVFPSPAGPSASSPARSNGPDGGPGGPLAPADPHIPPPQPQSEFQAEISKIPTPKVGDEAVLTECVVDERGRRFCAVKILNSGPGRPGLPDTFKVIREGLTVHQEPDFDKALGWVQENCSLIENGGIVPEDDGPLRPDQSRRKPPRPTVRHSYAERKTRGV